MPKSANNKPEDKAAPLTISHQSNEDIVLSRPIFRGLSNIIMFYQVFTFDVKNKEELKKLHNTFFSTLLHRHISGLTHHYFHSKMSAERIREINSLCTRIFTEITKDSQANDNWIIAMSIDNIRYSSALSEYLYKDHISDMSCISMDLISQHSRITNKTVEDPAKQLSERYLQSFKRTLPIDSQEKHLSTSFSKAVLVFLIVFCTFHYLIRRLDNTPDRDLFFSVALASAVMFTTSLMDAIICKSRFEFNNLPIYFQNGLRRRFEDILYPEIVRRPRVTSADSIPSEAKSQSTVVPHLRESLTPQKSASESESSLSTSESKQDNSGSAAVSRNKRNRDYRSNQDQPEQKIERPIQLVELEEIVWNVSHFNQDITTLVFTVGLAHEEIFPLWSKRTFNDSAWDNCYLFCPKSQPGVHDKEWKHFSGIARTGHMVPAKRHQGIVQINEEQASIFPSMTYVREVEDAKAPKGTKSITVALDARLKIKSLSDQEDFRQRRAPCYYLTSTVSAGKTCRLFFAGLPIHKDDLKPDNKRTIKLSFSR